MVPHVFIYFSLKLFHLDGIKHPIALKLVLWLLRL